MVQPQANGKTFLWSHILLNLMKTLRISGLLRMSSSILFQMFVLYSSNCPVFKLVFVYVFPVSGHLALLSLDKGLCPVYCGAVPRLP